jgi:predicted RNA binding protein YcfA (HicA-like mRNA interferase family)
LKNIYEAVEGCLSVPLEHLKGPGRDRIYGNNCMKSISGKDLCRLFGSAEGALLRIHGSHHVYGKPDSIVRLSVPIHGNKPLKIGLIKHLLQTANLSESDL